MDFSKRQNCTHHDCHTFKLEKTEGVIKIEQPRLTGNTGQRQTNILRNTKQATKNISNTDTTKKTRE